MTRWLGIVGIGEDGVEGLVPAARALIGGAALVVGGARHLALADPIIRGERMAWPRPIEAAFPAILARRGAPVAVLASGDPLLYGVGSMLCALVPAEERLVIPAVSSVALACAAMGWAVQDVSVLSCCGRPVERVIPLLQPGRRVIVLSADGRTPGEIAAILAARGFGETCIIVHEALGGPDQRVRRMSDFLADEPPVGAFSHLNLLAFEVRAAPGARVLPLAPGLPDAWFAHDGQLTRREVRAMTLAALGPVPGGVLWDVGCGAGSVGIEWLLRDPSCRAVGIERDPVRAARAGANAADLGVPQFDIRVGAAPEALAGLERPDAVFVGGGASEATLEACREALPPGGRMVVNGVTVETEMLLLAAQRRHGGTLTRIALSRLDSVGHLHAFRPAMAVLQWAAVKG